MSLPRWDDEMKFELLRLKSELRPENFRVLHSPIGIAAVTKGPPVAKPIPQMQKSPTQAATTRSRPERPFKKNPPPARASQGRSVSRLFFIHALDIAFVGLTIGLGLLLAAWIIDPKHLSENPDLLKQAAPLRFLLKSNALALVAGLYGFFSLYWLFFKLVTGSTLGESFLDNFWTLQNPRDKASVKDSGDS